MGKFSIVLGDCWQKNAGREVLLAFLSSEIFHSHAPDYTGGNSILVGNFVKLVGVIQIIITFL